MKEAALKAELEECQRLSTSQLPVASTTSILHLDPVPGEHVYSDYIIGNGQIPRYLKEQSQSNANLGTTTVKEEFVIEECYCPAAIKKEQNGGGVITPILDANTSAAISKVKFATKFEPNSLMTEECQTAVEISTKRMKQKRRRQKRRANANHQSILELRKQLRRAKNPQRYVENIAHCPEYQCGDSNKSFGPATDANANFGQRLARINHRNVRNCIAEENDDMAPIDTLPKPTTSSQALDVPSYPSEKMEIKMIMINIGNGNARFETSDGQIFTHRPLHEYVSILRDSEADIRGCYAYISFVYHNHTCHESARKTLKKFSRDIHSIAHLWSDGRVEAGLFEYTGHESKILPLSDFCEDLFGQGRSIFACNELEILLDKSWPFSVVTNVAHHCSKLILKEMSQRDHRLHSRLLDTLYEMKLPQNIEVTLELRFCESTKEFIVELEKRFQRSPGQCFKIQLLAPPNNGPPDMLLRNGHGLTLRTTRIHSQQTKSSYLRERVIIEQRSQTSIDDAQ